jgi:hypothetical protein
MMGSEPANFKMEETLEREKASLGTAQAKALQEATSMRMGHES